MPSNWREAPPAAPPAEPRSERSVSAIVPDNEKDPFDVGELIEALVDDDSLLEVQERWAKELVVGYARLDGRVIGIVANQPKVKGGVLFVDSADKAARFIWTCNAFNVPLLFLADVPGFMIGKEVERQGIIRHGAKMISAVSEATVPKISVIVRKAYGAGLYAMAGPAFEPDACIALPQAQIAVMGPEAAINAVFFNQIQEIEDPEERERFVAREARGVRGGHRHPPPRLRAGGRCGDRARLPPRRAGPPLRARRRQAAGLRRAAKPDHAGLAATQLAGNVSGPGARLLERARRPGNGTSDSLSVSHSFRRKVSMLLRIVTTGVRRNIGWDSCASRRR